MTLIYHVYPKDQWCDPKKGTQPFVAMDDYAALEARCRELEAALEFARVNADGPQAVFDRINSALETKPKSDQWVQDGKIFEEDADRCRNMAHKRYNLFNCTECDTSNRREKQ